MDDGGERERLGVAWLPRERGSGALAAPFSAVNLPVEAYGAFRAGFTT